MPVEDIVGCVASSASVDAVVSPHIGDGRSGFERGGGPSGRLHCEEWRWRFLEFPYAGPYGKKRRTRKAPPKRRGEQKAGAQFTTMELQDGNRPHGRRVRSGKRAQDRHGPASGVQDMLAWLRDCDRGCLSGNVKTRRRADSKKLEMADPKKAAAPLATHMQRLRGIRPEDEAPHVPESVGTEVPNDSRLRRQARLQHRHRLAELLAALRVRPSVSQTSAGKRMAASRRWRRRNQRRQKTRRCRRHREKRATERKMGGGGSVIAVFPPVCRSA